MPREGAVTKFRKWSIGKNLNCKSVTFKIQIQKFKIVYVVKDLTLSGRLFHNLGP